MKETILVTGCAGYIGSKLSCLLLREGYRVIGVDNFRYNNKHAIAHLIGNENFECYYADVRFVNMLKKHLIEADIIIPLAALVGEPVCRVYQREATETNLDSIIKLTEICSKDQRLIYPNTNSGYGINKNGECTEDSPLNPISLYGITKVQAEKCILDKNGTSLRLATVCGASARQRTDLMVNSFCIEIMNCDNKNIPFKIFEPHFQRNFVYIKDVCEAIIWVIQHNLKGVYNLGNPKYNMTKMELSKLICDCYDIDKDIIQIGDGQDPDKRDYVVSNKKILSTGFRFHYGIEEAISDMKTIMNIHTYEELKVMVNLV